MRVLMGRLGRASVVAAVSISAMTLLPASALSHETIRGRVSGLYRVTFVPLGTRGSYYARIWAATPGCISGDCAFMVSARDLGATTDPERFAFRYDGDIYDYASHGPTDCRFVKDANTTAPRQITIAGGFTITTDLRMRVTTRSAAAHATTLRGTYVIRATPTAKARAAGCKSTFVHRYRVTGRAQH